MAPPRKSLLTRDRPLSTSIYLRTRPLILPFFTLSTPGATLGFSITITSTITPNNMPAANINTALGYLATVSLYTSPNRIGYV